VDAVEQVCGHPDVVCLDAAVLADLQRTGTSDGCGVGKLNGFRAGLVQFKGGSQGHSSSSSATARNTEAVFPPSLLSGWRPRR